MFTYLVYSALIHRTQGDFMLISTESLKKNILSTIGAIPALPGIKRFSKTMDYKEYGGALFLGVKKTVVKAHGSRDEYLFYFTIKQAEKFAESKAVEILKEEFEKLK